MALLKRAASPPVEIDIRKRADPAVHFLWKTIVFYVTVAEQHVFVALAFVIVPDRSLVRGGPIRVPGPVPLNNFGHRPQGEARFLVRSEERRVGKEWRSRRLR